jgi:thymidylate kinase
MQVSYSNYTESDLEKVEAPEAPFLIKLFQGFETQQIDYCVLRNHSTLPTSHGGSDIDILFSPACFQTANKIILHTARDYGGRCISEMQAYRVITISFCGRYNNKWWGVRFDAFAYAGTNGCDILPVSHVLDRTILYRGIRVANPADAAIISFIKEIIGAGQTRRNYHQLAATAFADERKLFTAALQSYFGSKVFKKILSPLLKNEKLDLCAASSALKSGYLRTNSWDTVAIRLIDHFHRFRRVFNRPGAFIAFLGTDGAGKSTVIEALRPPLENAFHCPVNYRHMRPNLLPSIARLFGRSVSDGPVITPHASKPSGFWGSLLRLSYYSLDYILGYWVKVWPKMIRIPCCFIFDRYFQDYYIDSRRGRINLPIWFIKLFALIIPEPDLILCLGTDPEVMHARKQELPLEELKRQVKALQKFCRYNKRAVWIDTGCPIEESVEQALEAVTSKLAARHDK